MVQGYLFQILILIWLGVCAWQDGKHGEVSNWLTIPPLVGAAAFAVYQGQQTVFLFYGALAGLTILFFLNAMGGADVKPLAVLAAIWLPAFIGAMVAQGVWGLVTWLRKGRQAEFRALPAMTSGALIVFILSLFL